MTLVFHGIDQNQDLLPSLKIILRGNLALIQQIYNSENLPDIFTRSIQVYNLADNDLAWFNKVSIKLNQFGIPIW
jgi:hypothetical protein